MTREAGDYQRELADERRIQEDIKKYNQEFEQEYKKKGIIRHEKAEEPFGGFANVVTSMMGKTRARGKKRVQIFEEDGKTNDPSLDASGGEIPG